MKISLNIDEKFDETKITIECKALDSSIQTIIDLAKEKGVEFLIGKNGEMQHIIKPTDIHFFHADNNTVNAVTMEGSFALREKLYELEEILPASKFIRLSKSVIGNLHEMSRFEASFNGTLCVYFKSGKKEYVSRMYVKTIKEALKMNRREKS